MTESSRFFFCKEVGHDLLEIKISVYFPLNRILSIDRLMKIIYIFASYFFPSLKCVESNSKDFGVPSKDFFLWPYSPSRV